MVLRASVKRRLGPTEIRRQARGFSLGELREAGIAVDAARRLGIYVDLRRSSVHEDNVKALRSILAKA